MRSRHTGWARRSWLLAGLGVAAVAIGSYATYRTLTRESSEPASVSSAVARFRAAPAAARELPTPLRGRAPAPGIYRYLTQGFEVSHVLGTRRHTYPTTTTMTVAATPAGCLRTRWDVLATRWDAALACLRADGAWRLVSLGEEHAFAGHIDRRTYVCSPDSAYRPARLTSGATWRSSCGIGETTTANRGTVLGPRTIALDDRHVRTILLRTRTRIAGDTVGTGTTLTWVLPDTHLPVRQVVRNASTTDTVVGDVRYEERYTLALTSTRPLR